MAIPGLPSSMTGDTTQGGDTQQARQTGTSPFYFNFSPIFEPINIGTGTQNSSSTPTVNASPVSNPVPKSQPMYSSAYYQTPDDSPIVDLPSGIQINYIYIAAVAIIAFLLIRK